MEEEKTVSSCNNNKEDDEEEEDVLLPGFRFHPTDEELVGFYLKRKVDKKHFTIDLIKQVDIYKYDPWDLPKVGKASSVTEKEWYFFCRRGRKYRNSIRPNRVTGSGFWKATGIDKPIYSVGESQDCIGLKKSLVYYRGSAGKGTKTDWMMHEFRLPVAQNPTHSDTNNKDNLPEAEVWTLCRIFKRDVSHKKYASGWQNKKQNATASSSRTCTLDSECDSVRLKLDDKFEIERNHFMGRNQLFAGSTQVTPYLSFANSIGNFNGDQFDPHQNWDELRPMVDYTFSTSLLYNN